MARDLLVFNKKESEDGSSGSEARCIEGAVKNVSGTAWSHDTLDWRYWGGGLNSFRPNLVMMSEVDLQTEQVDCEVQH